MAYTIGLDVSGKHVFWCVIVFVVEIHCVVKATQRTLIFFLMGYKD